MKKLTKEEAAKFVVKRGSSSPVRTMLNNMEVGEIVMIEKSEWKSVNGPGQLVKRVALSRGWEFDVKTIYTGEGWLVERVK